MLSNGPGDPAENVEIVKEIKELAASGMPIFAICLGHQLMALAHDFKTEKLKFGHHGANHPVRDAHTGRVYISTQNHNYVIKEDSIDPEMMAQLKVWNISMRIFVQYSSIQKLQQVLMILHIYLMNLLK